MDTSYNSNKNNLCNYEKINKTSSSRTGGGGGRRATAAKLSNDKQSVAARERRHRISDRFKILQSLIPGGSKMDTVSMLEETIRYVNFLKAQIWLHETIINSVSSSDNYINNYYYGYNYDNPINNFLVGTNDDDQWLHAAAATVGVAPPYVQPPGAEAPSSSLVAEEVVLCDDDELMYRTTCVDGYKVW